jgi:hypothetical protein
MLNHEVKKLNGRITKVNDLSLTSLPEYLICLTDKVPILGW